MLHVRSIAVSCAVVCVFVVGIVGSISGLSPWACCRRATVAAVIVYLVAGVAVGVINATLLRAIVDSQINKERTRDSQS